MRSMKMLLVAAVVAALTLTGVGVAGADDEDNTASSVNVSLLATNVGGDAVLGYFTQNLRGYSLFTQDPTTQTITVKGAYRGLAPNSPYFTVVYGNRNCDPAKAFPIGPFFSNARGRATVNLTSTPAPFDLGSGTMSASVRIGDTAADIDKDGKLGPTDVVAVAGQPSIGLVECNTSPFVRNAP